MKISEPQKIRAQRPQGETRPRPGHLGNILVAIDFSSFSKRALDYALVLAETFDSKLTLIHVVVPSGSLPTRQHSTGLGREI
jgi:nucleotide-binding universal stress UspA family protein